MTDTVVFRLGASVGKTELLGLIQLLDLVTLKRQRPNWQAVRRQQRRERKLIRTLGLGSK